MNKVYFCPKCNKIIFNEAGKELKCSNCFEDLVQTETTESKWKKMDDSEHNQLKSQWEYQYKKEEESKEADYIDKFNENPKVTLKKGLKTIKGLVGSLTFIIGASLSYSFAKLFLNHDEAFTLAMVISVIVALIINWIVNQIYRVLVPFLMVHFEIKDNLNLILEVYKKNKKQ